MVEKKYEQDRTLIIRIWPGTTRTVKAGELIHFQQSIGSSREAHFFYHMFYGTIDCASASCYFFGILDFNSRQFFRGLGNRFFAF